MLTVTEVKVISNKDGTIDLIGPFVGNIEPDEAQNKGQNQVQNNGQNKGQNEEYNQIRQSFSRLIIHLFIKRLFKSRDFINALLKEFFQKVHKGSISVMSFMRQLPRGKDLGKARSKRLLQMF